jgi:prepilin-type N-terminal cleavage/methylation domain-containing protein
MGYALKGMCARMYEPRKGVTTMKTTRRSGFTLLEIMMAVTIIGFLAGLTIPAFMRSRRTTQATRCVTNLKLIEAAKEQWAMENFADIGSVCVRSDILVYFKKGFPECPGSGSYEPLTPIGSNVLCSLGATLGHALKD